MTRLLEKIKNDSNYLVKGRDDLSSYLGDTMYQGDPEAVLRARDAKDISGILGYCHAEKIPVTFCGSQTSMTGASAADRGLLISTEKMDALISLDPIDDTSAMAICQPGIVVGDFKRAMQAEGWFFPPAPTSQDQARLGACIATNATGEDSYKYGSMRPYVEELKVLMADGSPKTFVRGRDNCLVDELNRAGYHMKSRSDLDWLIGSEGTLAFIQEVRVRLIREPHGFFALLVPFAHQRSALEFIVHIASGHQLKPRALEYIDRTALTFMKTHPSFPQGLADCEALVYLKQEFTDEAQKSTWLDAWLAAVTPYTSPSLLSEIVYAEDLAKKEAIRHWRHHIPTVINEKYRHFWAVGGGKVGSDWWVPIPRLLEMMDFIYSSGEASKIPFLAFAHLGQGHPHVNFLCQTPQEKVRAEALLLEACRKAVALGGGVAGEHGIGKIHRDYMPIQWNEAALQKMRDVKTRFDPNWILGQGNIFK